MNTASLLTATGAFDKSAIMRRAYDDGQFAFAYCRSLADRRRQLSNWLRKAWLAARREAFDRARRIEREAYARQAETARAYHLSSVAARYDNDADALRGAISRETTRDIMDFDRVETLEAALTSLDASMAEIAARRDIVQFLDAAE